MNIREATLNDVEAIATVSVASRQDAYRGILPDAHLDSLNVAAVSETYRQSLSRGGFTVLIAEIEGEVAGFVSYGKLQEPTQPEPVWTITSLYVAPAHMSRGVGTRLMRHAESTMHGVACLRVIASNSPSRAFYEHNGWKPEPGTERMETWDGQDMETIRYRKVISA